MRPKSTLGSIYLDTRGKGYGEGLRGLLDLDREVVALSLEGGHDLDEVRHRRVRLHLLEQRNVQELHVALLGNLARALRDEVRLLVITTNELYQGLRVQVLDTTRAASQDQTNLQLGGLRIHVTELCGLGNLVRFNGSEDHLPMTPFFHDSRHSRFQKSTSADWGSTTANGSWNTASLGTPQPDTAPTRRSETPSCPPAPARSPP